MMRAVVLLGRHGPDIARAMADVALPDDVPVELLSASHDGQTAMHHAVKRAIHFAMPGDVVLLSPACASFDMFSDYGQRGNAFSNAVKAIACSKAVSGIEKGAADAGQQG